MDREQALIDILNTLREKVQNPAIANGQAAVEAVVAYSTWERKTNAIQVQSPAKEVLRAREPGENEAGGAPGVGEGDPGKRETTRTRGALRGAKTI